MVRIFPLVVITLLAFATPSILPASAADANQETNATFPQEMREFHTTESGLPSNDIRTVRFADGKLIALAGESWIQLDGDSWTKIETPKRRPGEQDDLFIPADIPLLSVTCAAGKGNTVWYGSPQGLMRYDGKHWAYRQGKRWLPNDNVRDIAVDEDGSAWIATSAGLSHIFFKPMTLAEKAAFYEQEIDLYNRRTEYGYVIESHTDAPGKKTNVTQHDSDNDGLWTAMYGAGECFAYAATKDPEAKRRAKNAFEALRFLSVAPRGGSHPAPKGFIARTVVPTTEENPNERGGYTLEGQRQSRARGDSMWRVYEPRWPTSEDGKWYWKSDTSSDELDGHYFFNALYYDLVADSEEEKERVREIIRDNIDHLIKHGFRLHDHDGPTRWADYSPESLNHDLRWATERGLNSLSMLSYLATAAHITGDTKYHEVAAELRDKHGYHQNLLVPKIQAGFGTGNQSDDEMAFMCYYNLIRYEPDSTLKQRYLYSFRQYWLLEKPEMNPFFNYCFAACSMGEEYANQWGRFRMSPSAGWQEDSLETLERFPLDRFNWSHDNSARRDIVGLTGPSYGTGGTRGMRRNGKVVPVDESQFNHWNYSPWSLRTGGDGRTLADGAVYLLPYYMGLHHGYVQ